MTSTKDLFMDCIVETHINNEDYLNQRTGDTRRRSTPMCENSVSSQQHRHIGLTELIDPLGLNEHFRRHPHCCLYYQTLDETLSDNEETAEVTGTEQETLLHESLLREQREKFMLEIHKDPCMQFKRNQKYFILDLPLDSLLYIFSYLLMEEIISLAPICKTFNHIYQHDVIWERLVRERSPYVYNYAETIASSIDNDHLEELLFRKHKIKRNDTGYGASRYTEWKKRRNKRGKSSNNKSKHSNTNNLSHKKREKHNPALKNNVYYTAFKKRVLLARKRKEEKIMLKMYEDTRRYYEKVLRKPQKWCELFYICFFIPFFFLISLACTICAGLYLDQFILNHSVKRTKILSIIMGPFILIATPLYIIATCLSALTEYLRMLRWNSQFDSTFPLIYFGFFWLPLLVCLYAMKEFILPDFVPWRAVCAPQWAYTCVYIALCLFLHRRFNFMKWEIDQKIVFGFMTTVNMCVTFTTGFLSAKLDQTLSPSLMYSSFVFSPIWLTLFLGLIAVPIGAYVFMHEEGPKFTMFVYFPLSLAGLLPFIAFFVLLALQLDGILQTYYMVVFSPLYACQLIFFGVSLGVSFLWNHFCT